MGDTRHEDITKQPTIGVEDLDGGVKHKTIYPLGDDELEGYEMLGRGTAEFPGHAVYMGFTHVPDFFKRVAGYRLVHGYDAEIFDEVTDRPFGSIEFFERVARGDEEAPENLAPCG